MIPWAEWLKVSPQTGCSMGSVHGCKPDHQPSSMCQPDLACWIQPGVNLTPCTRPIHEVTLFTSPITCQRELVDRACRAPHSSENVAAGEQQQLMLPVLFHCQIFVEDPRAAGAVLAPRLSPAVSLPVCMR